MPSIALSLLEEIRPALDEIIRGAVKAALNEEQPRYPERVAVDLAAEITGYSKNSLYQMNHLGKVPGAIKIGGKLMFETKALQEWVRSGATPTTNIHNKI